MTSGYGDVPLGVECALPGGYSNHADHGSGRARHLLGKEDGPAPGAALLLWQYLRQLAAPTILPSTSSMAWSQRPARRGS